MFGWRPVRRLERQIAEVLFLRGDHTTLQEARWRGRRHSNPI
jgi:hypothetical protein